MEKEHAWDLAGEVSPERAFQLGMMVGKMIEAGLSATVRWAVSSNMQAFRSGMRAGLSTINPDDLFPNVVIKEYGSAAVKPHRKLRVKAARALPT
jgi:hypothetical protein